MNNSNKGCKPTYSKNEKAVVKIFKDKVVIECTNVNYFINFFDLETNYTEIKQKLSEFEVLKPMLNSCYGIRILNQDKIEMLFSFIVSQKLCIKKHFLKRKCLMLSRE